MPAPYSINATRVTGEIITAANYNADHQVHADNNIPTSVDDYSTTVAQMQSTVDPGEVGSESQATTLAGELERLRFTIKEITGEAQWYVTPDTTLAAAATVTTAVSGITKREYDLIKWGIIH